MAISDPHEPRLRPSRIDECLEEARARGLFEDLDGQGQPLRDLGEVSDPAWWGRKFLRREKISLLPPSLEIRRTTEKTLASLATLRTEQEVRARLEALNREIAKVNARTFTGPATQLAALDVAAHIARWRAERSEQDPA